MMDVLILSILQGIAEFLPISSSGHLVLGKNLLGIGEAGLRLDIFLHVGTLVAVFAFYRAIVSRLVKGVFSKGVTAIESWVYLAKIVLSAVPAGIVGVLFKDSIESAFSDPRRVGMALIFTGIVLIGTRFLPRGGKGVSFLQAFLMGLAQAVAILPGVSRSGMTLAAARAGRIDAEKAAEFSFLMSAPPIAGAALLEIVKSLKESSDLTLVASSEIGWGLCAFGAVVAAVVGYFSLKFLLSSLKSDKFWLFGPYAVLAGVVTLCVCH